MPINEEGANLRKKFKNLASKSKVANYKYFFNYIKIFN